MTCTKKIYIKIKKKKNNIQKKEKLKENKNEKQHITKFKLVLKILIGLTIFILSILLSKYIYYNIKAFKLNKNIEKETFDTLRLFYENLKKVILDVKKLNNSNLSLSQTINLNNILKYSANTINDNILMKNNGTIVEDKYLGIYKYSCENLKLKKNIGKKIIINNLFCVGENRLLTNKKFTIKDYSFELMNNIYNTLFL